MSSLQLRLRLPPLPPLRSRWRAQCSCSSWGAAAPCRSGSILSHDGSCPLQSELSTANASCYLPQSTGLSSIWLFRSETTCTPASGHHALALHLPHHASSCILPSG